jgi:hypothetical protein
LFRKRKSQSQGFLVDKLKSSLHKFDFNRLFGAWHVKNIVINFDLAKRVKGNQRDRNLQCELLKCLCPMFISFNSFGIYLFRVPSIFVNMGRKGGGPKETNTNCLSFSVYFYFNGLKLQNRSLSELFSWNVNLIEHKLYMNTVKSLLIVGL